MHLEEADGVAQLLAELCPHLQLVGHLRSARCWGGHLEKGEKWRNIFSKSSEENNVTRVQNLGPGQLGLTVQFLGADNWAPGPNCLRPNCPLSGAQLSLEPLQVCRWEVILKQPTLCHVLNSAQCLESKLWTQFSDDSQKFKFEFLGSSCCSCVAEGG